MNSPYRSTVMPGTSKDVARQIVAWKPDLVWCYHGRAASNADFLAFLRRHGSKTAAFLPDEPYESGETCKFSPKFDYVFSLDPCTVEAHRLSRQNRRGVYYLPVGVDPSHFQYRDYFDETGCLREERAFFLGNGDLIPRRDFLEPVERLLENVDIRFFPHREKGPVTKHHKKWVPHDKQPDFYADCWVGLNVHRSPVITKTCFKRRVLGRGAHDKVPDGLQLCRAMPQREGTGFWNDGNLPAAHVNPRFMEMAACGTLVVSDDHRTELRRMFPFAPRASDPAHFYELVDHYMRNPQEAEGIGRLCYETILKRHTYQHRAAEVLIRVGLGELLPDSLSSFLEQQEDWLTPQDCGPHGIESYWVRTGRSERWSPAYGMSWIKGSGRESESSSLDAPTGW